MTFHDPWIAPGRHCERPTRSHGAAKQGVASFQAVRINADAVWDFPTRCRNLLTTLGVYDQGGARHSVRESEIVSAACHFPQKLHAYQGCPSGRDARAAGESEQRLYMLSAWRGAPVGTYKGREQSGTMSRRLITRKFSP